MAGGVLMHQQGMEAIMHVYCRDRNTMALQGDLGTLELTEKGQRLLMDA